MSGKNQFDAAQQAKALLINSQKGSRRSVKTHIKRSERIAIAIWCRFHVTPATWRAKHLRWFLEHYIRNLSPSTQYDHWLTVSRILATQDHYFEWMPLLQGTWLRKNGNSKKIAATGRPLMLSHRIKKAISF